MYKSLPLVSTRAGPLRGLYSAPGPVPSSHAWFSLISSFADGKAEAASDLDVIPDGLWGMNQEMSLKDDTVLDESPDQRPESLTWGQC